MSDCIIFDHELEHLLEVVRQAVAETARYEDGLPHIVLFRSGATGEVTYSGPFPTLADAQEVIAHERHQAADDPDLTFQTAPLYPPLRLEECSRAERWKKFGKRP